MLGESVQPGTVGVAERVEPYPAKSQLQTCRNQMVCTNRIGVIGPTGHRAWEEPSPLGFETDRLPFPQFENEAPFDRDLVL
jgi:hypothetical protein